MTSSTAIQIPGYVVGTWDIDASHSTVGFSVRHMMVSKVRGNFAEADHAAAAIQQAFHLHHHMQGRGDLRAQGAQGNVDAGHGDPGELAAEVEATRPRPGEALCRRKRNRRRDCPASLQSSAPDRSGQNGSA